MHRASFGNIPPPVRSAPIRGYIRSLLQARNRYKDALVYGRQLSVPGTSSPQIAAFLYQGTENQVLTVVNNGAATTTASVQLPASMSGTEWTTLALGGALTGTVAASSSGLLTLPDGLPAAPKTPADPMGGVAVLVRATPGPYPRSYPVSHLMPLMNETFSEGTMNHWTVSSGQWSVTPPPPFGSLSLPGQLNVRSSGVEALAFYDLYSGGDFTFSGFMSLDSVGAEGWAGLGFRLSDNPQNSDAAEQGY